MASLLHPVLAEITGSVEAMRRLCRLCDRDVCDPCPVTYYHTADVIPS